MRNYDYVIELSNVNVTRHERFGNKIHSVLRKDGCASAAL